MSARRFKVLQNAPLGALCNTFNLHSAIIGLEKQFFVFLRVAIVHRFYCRLNQTYGYEEVFEELKSRCLEHHIWYGNETNLAILNLLVALMQKLLNCSWTDLEQKRGLKHPNFIYLCGDHSGSVVEYCTWLQIEGLWVRTSPEALCWLSLSEQTDNKAPNVTPYYKQMWQKYISHATPLIIDNSI